MGKKRKADDDSVQTFAHELRFPTTTHPTSLTRAMRQRHEAQHMSVVYTTYHSTDVSGIVNDANDWAIETMSNPKYPLELFLRVITVSLETVRIVQSLPRLNI